MISYQADAENSVIHPDVKLQTGPIDIASGPAIILPVKRSLAAAPALAGLCLLVAGLGCAERDLDRFRPPYIRVLLYNRTAQPFDVLDLTAEPGRSVPVVLRHADVETLAIFRAADTIGQLVLLSQVPAADPDDYDGTVTFYAPAGDSSTYVVEYSPWFDVELLRP